MKLEPFASINPRNYTYDLPEERIALFPAEQRDHSKLLIRQSNGDLKADIFKNIASYLPAESCVFINNSRVIPARLRFTRETGSQIEVFCLNPVNPSDYEASLSATRSCIWECLIGNMKRFGGSSLGMSLMVDTVPVTLKAEMINHQGDTAVIRFSWENEEVSFASILEATGKTPLPPYIKREAVAIDRERYQTIYSRLNGSVAAPTAGLHFTAEVFSELRRRSIQCVELTLHVGAGTFQPIKSSSTGSHRMHAEVFRITPDLIQNLLKTNGMITCVGTTSLRTLESLYWIGVKIIRSGGKGADDLHMEQWEAYELPREYSMKQSIGALGEWMDKQQEKEFISYTRLMIVPGYAFRVADSLVTNFHQPHSTLLLLIAAFIGESWEQVYRFALENNFRFLSYGDSSLLFR